MAAATIEFTVHNRKDMLIEAIRLAKLQTVPVEIIVMDDASTDGVEQALAEAHPDVKYERSEVSRGLCYQRNRGIELATSEVVFPLDDDSFLVSPYTVEQTLTQFADPSVNVVAVPFKNILQNDRTIQMRSGQEREAIAAFIGCAHAVRREPFMRIGGFAEEYVFLGEEGDASIRLLDAGMVVERGTADPIHHMQPADRRSNFADYYGRRNDVLFYYLRAPSGTLPLRIIGTVIKGLKHGYRHQCLKATILGLWDGFKLIASGRVKRTPVKPSTFKTFMHMKLRGALPLEQARSMAGQSDTRLRR